jgi:hypothetical protein
MAWFGARRDQKQTSSSSNSSEVHTPENPYCNDLSCFCHTDLDYHDLVTSYDTNDYDSEAYDYALSTLLA